MSKKENFNVFMQGANLCVRIADLIMRGVEKGKERRKRRRERREARKQGNNGYKTL